MVMCQPTLDRNQTKEEEEIKPIRTKAQAAAAEEKHGYEFFGPPGAFIITTFLPPTAYAFALLCNDRAGCPASPLLHPSTLTLEKLKYEIGWEGLSTIFSWEAFFVNLGWYALHLVLNRVLPATYHEGTELRSGGKLKYKFNAFYTGVFIMSVLAAGTLLHGAEFIVWTYIWDNFVRLLTANILLAYGLATYCYLMSFSVRSWPNNEDQRELAAGGHSGNMLYDWFIGRELNPRVDIPFIGEIDIKAFMEIRPGLLGWIVLDCAFIAAQYRHYGYVTDSILIASAAQAIYVFDAFYMEPAILTTIDIISDGFGFMLAFGDIVWVPFVYSMQARYLAVHPVMLGYWNILVFGILGTGYWIFRGANNEKNRFRTNPNDPRIKHLLKNSIKTKAGTRLLTTGWWGTARHINYLGDWLLSWSYSLPTGIAGYQVYHGASALAVKAASTVKDGQSLPPGGHQMITPTSVVVAPGDARGWGMIITYFYLIYFAVLLIHRERRDEEKCRRKYGKDWDEYTKRVPSRIIPYVY